MLEWILLWEAVIIGDYLSLNYFMDFWRLQKQRNLFFFKLWFHFKLWITHTAIAICCDSSPSACPKFSLRSICHRPACVEQELLFRKTQYPRFSWFRNHLVLRCSETIIISNSYYQNPQMLIPDLTKAKGRLPSSVPKKSKSEKKTIESIRKTVSHGQEPFTISMDFFCF